jgi:acyl dehydratase
MSDLELDSSFVGAKFRPLTLEISARRCMNFAAGIFDPSACYLDDLRPGGIVAHPMLVPALTWQISSRFQEYLIAQDFPFAVARRQVHYTESIVWHRLLHPNDRLTVEGQIVAILPHRSGSHLMVQYKATDSDGQPVFSETTGAMLRGVRCLDQGRCLQQPELAVDQSGSSSLWEQSIELHPLAALVYDGCAEVSFPIHSSIAFAQSVGLPGTLMQGTATLAMALSELIRRESSGNPRHVRRLDCRFVGMVFPGSRIIVRLHERVESAELTALRWSVCDHQGAVAIQDGKLEIKKDPGD